MTTEVVGIQVTDKVDGTIVKKLRDIAAEATKGASAVDKLQAALSSANTSAVDRLAAAQTKAAGASQKLASAMADSGSKTENLYDRVNRLRSSIDPLYAAQMRYNNELNEANALLGAGAIKMNVYQQAVSAADAKLKAATAGLDRMTTALQRNARGTGAARANTANLVAQYNDIGVSLAGGMNPLLVLVQQGSQISYVAGQMENGWLGVLRVTGMLLLKLAPLLVVMGGIALVFRQLRNEARETAGDLNAYANSLGLTAKEVKELEDVTVTAGDTIKAAWQVSMESILDAAGITTQDIKTFFSDAADFIVEAFKFTVAASRALFFTLVEVAKVSAGNIGTIFSNIRQGASNLVNGRDLAEGLRPLQELKIGDTLKQEFDEANAALDAFGKRITDRAAQIAKARIAAQAKAIIEDRPDSAAKTVKDTPEMKRAEALRLVNMQLDNELERMGMLKDAREVQQRLDQIDQTLSQKKIKLTDEERTALQSKLVTMQQASFAQNEADRILANIITPARNYNATLQAANDLLAKNAISQTDYSAAVNMAGLDYAAATDPLFRFKQGIEAAENATRQYGIATQQTLFLEQLRQEYQDRGLSLYDETTGKLRDEVAEIIRKNDALREQQLIQSELGQVLAPILDQNLEIAMKQDVYNELERLRQADLINEETYQRALAGLYVKYNQERLNAASDFFGALASVTKQGTGVIGAIGKAAAIAQATIDGYVAVQKALASLPPPFNFVAAAAVAIKTGVQVAGIASTNVGSFATGGQFMVGGRGGVDQNNINMNVSRGERVTIETPQQQRANDNQAAPQPQQGNVRIINQLDPQVALDALDTAAGERLIVNIIERNPQAMQRILGSR